MRPLRWILVGDGRSGATGDRVAVLRHELAALALLRRRWSDGRETRVECHLRAIRRINRRRIARGLRPIL